MQYAQDANSVFTGFANTRVRFASIETGRAILMADDEWLGATSEFQRRAVMGNATPVTLEAFRRWNGDAVRPWGADQRARWRKALESLVPAFTALRIPLPEDIWLIASNGQESANAPYTRSNAVVLPSDVSNTGYSDSMLMAHELWHVASRHAPKLATRLYAEIGFEPMPELVFPPMWVAARIANPDAPSNRHAMRLQVEGRSALVTPVLMAARTTLRAGESFFSVMEPRLLELELRQTSAHAKLSGNEPIWHALNGAHDYLHRLGSNSGYVIHYEETMADNIALLTTGARPRNPALLARIKSLLQAAR